jgi:GNAT superfamily N-acetyltransferase
MKIRKFNVKKSSDVEDLAALECETEWFDTSAALGGTWNYCPSAVLARGRREPSNMPYSYVFVAIHHEKSPPSIAGQIVITDHRPRLRVWTLDLASSRAFTNASFKGTGSKLLEHVIEDAQRNGIHFIIVEYATGAGLGLYKKYGFQTYANKGHLVRYISGRDRILHPNTFRSWDLDYLVHANEYAMSTRGNGRTRRMTHLKKSEDTYEKWRDDFAVYDPARDIYDLKYGKNVPPMIIPDSMIRDIRPYPDWVYGSSRRPYKNTFRTYKKKMNYNIEQTQQ